jgi:hypothetical protein
MLRKYGVKEHKICRTGNLCYQREVLWVCKPAERLKWPHPYFFPSIRINKSGTTKRIIIKFHRGEIYKNFCTQSNFGPTRTTITDDLHRFLSK